MGALPKHRKPLCAKCSDQGHTSVFEHPGRKNKVGGVIHVPCPKNCAASKRWRAARDAARSS
jgi:hypothetical protein